MALFGKRTTKKDEDKKPAQKAATKSRAVNTAKESSTSKKSKKSVAMEAPVTNPAVIPAIASNASPSSKITGTSSVLLGAHITEKANLQAEKNNVYTFKVSGIATKHAIVHAVKTVYKVTPTAVRVVSLPNKSIFVRGRKAFKSGFKKAYITLKKGEKIDAAQ
jgi:large subunit ribosomal protein L23